MTKIFSFVILYFSLSFNMYAQSVYEHDITLSTGEKLDWNQYKNKTLLIVNIATRCGYTGQLDGLEQIYQDFNKKGLVVIGVPSNDFMGQTPEDDEEVTNFCKTKYNVTFPLTKKSVVKGDKKISLFKDLIKLSGSDKEIGWNFEKFLVSKSGLVVGRFKSGVKPQDKELLEAIKNNI
jgi:glutathione peroxidase